MSVNRKVNVSKALAFELFDNIAGWIFTFVSLSRLTSQNKVYVSLKQIPGSVPKRHKLQAIPDPVPRAHFLGPAACNEAFGLQVATKISLPHCPFEAVNRAI